MNTAELQTQITFSKAYLAQLNAAITAFADPTVLRYDLDTGQSITRVQRNELPAIIKSRQVLMEEICTLEARLTGGGVTRGQPAW